MTKNIGQQRIYNLMLDVQDIVHDHPRLQSELTGILKSLIRLGTELRNSEPDPAPSPPIPPEIVLIDQVDDALFMLPDACAPDKNWRELLAASTQVAKSISTKLERSNTAGADIPVTVELLTSLSCDNTFLTINEPYGTCMAAFMLNVKEVK